MLVVTNAFNTDSFVTTPIDIFQPGNYGQKRYQLWIMIHFPDLLVNVPRTSSCLTVDLKLATMVHRANSYEQWSIFLISCLLHVSSCSYVTIDTKLATTVKQATRYGFWMNSSTTQILCKCVLFISSYVFIHEHNQELPAMVGVAYGCGYNL